jgi:hypothetical protein
VHETKGVDELVIVAETLKVIIKLLNQEVRAWDVLLRRHCEI